MYEQSLEYFDKAVKINEQIGVKDPGPHLSIARTYSQLGEFFIAARNVQTALEYEPTNADIYGQLGVIYFRSRNYEGSIYYIEMCDLWLLRGGILSGTRTRQVLSRTLVRILSM